MIVCKYSEFFFLFQTSQWRGRRNDRCGYKNVKTRVMQCEREVTHHSQSSSMRLSGHVNSRLCLDNVNYRHNVEYEVFVLFI